MPAETIGSMLEKSPTTREEPTVELRFVRCIIAEGGDAGHLINRMILQQRWVIYHHRPGRPDHVEHRETEWRDVPLVEE